MIDTTSPVTSGRRACTTLKLSFNTTSDPRGNSLVVDVGMQPDTHLAPTGEHVDGAVVVLADDDAVRRWGLRELVDLVAERGDVLARLAKGVAQLLVLGNRLGQLSLGLQESLFECPLPLGGIGKSTTQLVDFLLEHRDLGLQHRLDGVRIICHGRNLHARGARKLALTCRFG